MPLCNECVHFREADSILSEIPTRCAINEEQYMARHHEIMGACDEHFTPRNEPYEIGPVDHAMPMPPPRISVETRVSKKKTTKKKKPYISQDGFEIIPLRRGFTEIVPLWDILNSIINKTKSDVFICGGYARWCASPKYKPEPAGDIDIYSQSKKAYNLLKKILLNNEKLKIKDENEMAITFEHPLTGKFHYMPPIQIIKPVKDGSIVAVGDKTTILSNFDFTIIRAAIESPTEVMVDKDFIHDEEKGVLRLKNIHCPVSSLLRCLKYVKKGYWLRPIEAARLFYDWMERDVGYREKVILYIEKADKGEGLTKEQVDELERLMRID